MNHNKLISNRLNEKNRNPHHSLVSKTPNNKHDKSDIIHMRKNENKGKSIDLRIISILKNENINISMDFGTFKKYICPDLVNTKLLHPLNKHKLSGSDKTTLQFIGTTTIY